MRIFFVACDIVGEIRDERCGKRTGARRRTLGSWVGAQGFRPAYPKLVPLGEPAPRKNPMGSEHPSPVQRRECSVFGVGAQGFRPVVSEGIREQRTWCLETLKP